MLSGHAVEMTLLSLRPARREKLHELAPSAPAPPDPDEHVDIEELSPVRVVADGMKIALVVMLTGDRQTIAEKPSVSPSRGNVAARPITTTSS